MTPPRVIVVNLGVKNNYVTKPTSTPAQPDIFLRRSAAGAGRARRNRGGGDRCSRHGRILNKSDGLRGVSIPVGRC